MTMLLNVLMWVVLLLAAYLPIRARERVMMSRDTLRQMMVRGEQYRAEQVKRRYRVIRRRPARRIPDAWEQRNTLAGEAYARMARFALDA